MVDHSLRNRTTENASGIAATVVTGTWLALLMLDFPSEIWLAVMLFGYIAVVPVVSMLFDEEESEERTAESVERTESEPTDATEDDDALERLRRRYAEGKLTDEQFERKLERLLETETLEDAESRSGIRNDHADVDTERVPERDRN
jgi:uncharacterized membrane protein